MNLSIPAWREGHYLSLEEILRTLGDSCSEFEWILHAIDVAPEPGTDVLLGLDPGQPLSYSTVLRMVTPQLQVIDGEAIAVDPASSEKRLLIRAVDSTSWDIETEMQSVVDKIFECYPWATAGRD